MPSVLEDLYHANVVLWVEDELTRAALRLAWGLAPKVQVQVAGRKESVVLAEATGLRAMKDLDRVPPAWIDLRDNLRARIP